MTLFARCQIDLSVSMGPVPILFSLDPFPPLPTPHARPQTKMGGGNGMPYPANMAPTRAATVSAPVRRGGGDDVSPREGGTGVGDSSTPRIPRRSVTAVASVGGPQGIDAGPSSSSLPIRREGFVPQVGAARPRSRSFSSFGAHVPAPIPQERRSVQVHRTAFFVLMANWFVQSGRAGDEGAGRCQRHCPTTQNVSPTCVDASTRSISA